MEKVIQTRGGEGGGDRGSEEDRGAAGSSYQYMPQTSLERASFVPQTRSMSVRRGTKKRHGKYLSLTRISHVLVLGCLGWRE